MKKGDFTTIELPDNTTKTVQFIGAGSFAKCYTDGESVYSFVKHGLKYTDYSKEGIALWANKENPYIPNYESLGDFNDGEGNLYKSPLYSPLTAKNRDAWNEYKLLKSITLNWTEIKSCYSPADQNEKLIDKFENSGKFNPILIEALRDINNSLRNYGDSYCFEFPKCNLKVDSSGHLILLDVIFNRDALKESKPRRFIS